MKKSSLFSSSSLFDLSVASPIQEEAVNAFLEALGSYREERQHLRVEALRAIDAQFDRLPPGTRLNKGFLCQAVALALGATAENWSAYVEFAGEVLGDPTLFHSQVGKGGGCSRLK